MEKNGYIAGHPIPTIEALQSWLDRGQPVFYGDGLVGATALRMSALAYLEAAIKRGDLRYGLPGPVKPEPEAEQPRRYRTRSRTVEALRWTGKNGAALLAFLGAPNVLPEDLAREKLAFTFIGDEGLVGVVPGDYVVKNDKGIYTVATASVFARDYEPVEAAADVKPPSEASVVCKRAATCKKAAGCRHASRHERGWVCVDCVPYVEPVEEAAISQEIPGAAHGR